MHSPLLPKIGILEAAQFQQIFWHQPGLAESRKMIVLKGEIIAQINEFISKDFNKMYKEAIQSVLHLALLDVRRIDRGLCEPSNWLLVLLG